MSPNQEQEWLGTGRDIPNGLPFQISVDGVPIDGSLGTAEDDQRTVDVAFDRMDIQVTFDGLRLDKAANLQANKAGAKVGEKVVFTPYWNYGAFVSRAEIRVFKSDVSTDGKPIPVLPLRAGRSVAWTMPEQVKGNLQFLLRLGNKRNRIDETATQRLKLFSRDHDQSENEDIQNAGYGQNALVKSNIPVNGGIVTVFGDSVPLDTSVYVLGLPVPVDSSRKFVTEQLLPAGAHNVTVAVLDENARGLEFQRNVYIPDQDFFYIALGDLTVSTQAASGPTELVGAHGKLGSNLATNARLAGFLKGKLFGDVFVTAQADTGESSVGELFTNFLDKDPSKLIDRIDDDRTCTTFGDDSTIKDETPSQGKFYVKVEKGSSHVMWGNFSTNITGTEFARVNRSLYGGQLKYRTEASTGNGDPYFSVDGFIAQQGTIPHRDEFRGTGNSVYFLSFQDLVVGGEKLTVEVRDPFNGGIKSRRELIYGEDYDIDYIQGRIILTEPLPSTVDDGYLVSFGSGLTGDQVYLVTEYDYAPVGANLDELFYGGRVSAWAGQYLNVGATAVIDQRGLIDKQLLEADATLAVRGNTYIRAEIAQSTGDPRVTFGSIDGGYFVDANTSPAQLQTLIPDGNPLTIIGDLNNADDMQVVIRTRDLVTGEESGSKVLVRDEDYTLVGNTLELIGDFAGFDDTITGGEGALIASTSADGNDVELSVNPNSGLNGDGGYRLEASFAADDFGLPVKARATAYDQHRDAGFAGASAYTADEVNQIGGSLTAPAGPITLAARFDQTNNVTQESETRRLNFDARGKIRNIDGGIGLGFTDTFDAGVQTAGSSTVGADIGATFGDIRVGAFGQYDLSNVSGTNGGRVGFNGSAQLNENFAVKGSIGTDFENGGTTPLSERLFVSVSTDVTVNDFLRLNAAYELAGRTNAGTGAGQIGGTMNFGAKARFDSGVDFYVNETVGHAGQSINTLQHAFGVNYAPSQALSFGFSGEIGQVRKDQSAAAGPDNPFLNRPAATLQGRYSQEELTVGAAAEYRWEESSQDLDSDGNNDTRATLIFKGDSFVSLSPNWRLVANAAVAFSQFNGNFEDGNFVEGSVGAACRPIDHDRLNMLVRGTVLYDLPTRQQVVTGARQADYRQRSLIGEADAIFQLTKNIDVGAKYGVKIGEVTSCRTCNDWFGSNIHLAVGRLDWHAVKNWDALLEGRLMYQGNVGN
ncbi:MAG: hypothetical protein ISQ28_02355, partial [Alphaproteobacteria bacterium]|nr:hypothetical protein [Alphaproteobacteria bacterium]